MHAKITRREFVKGAGALGAAAAIDIRFLEKMPAKLLSVFTEETTLKCILVSNLGVINAGKTTVSMLLTRLMMQQGHTVNNFKIQGRINDNWVYLLYGGKLLYKIWKYPFAAEYNIFDASTISWIERKALGVLGFYSNADFGIIEGDWSDSIYKYWPRMTTVGVLDVEKLPVNSSAVNKVDAVILNKVSHREQMKMPENCIGYVEKPKNDEDPYMLQMPYEIDVDWLIDNAVEITVPKIELFDVYPTSAEEKLKIGMIGMPGMHFFSEFWDVLEAHEVEIMPVFKREDLEQCDGLMIGYWKQEKVDWSEWFDKLKRHILAAIQDGMPVLGLSCSNLFGKYHVYPDGATEKQIGLWDYYTDGTKGNPKKIKSVILRDVETGELVTVGTCTHRWEIEGEMPGNFMYELSDYKFGYKGKDGAVEYDTMVLHSEVHPMMHPGLIAGFVEKCERYSRR